MVEQCYKKHRTVVNPIIEWKDDDVWKFIKGNGIHYCSLYDEGYKRLGCIGCPMASRKDREKGLHRWQFARRAYLTAFGKLLRIRKERGKPTEWETPEDVMQWWLESDVLAGQYSFFDEEE